MRSLIQNLSALVLTTGILFSNQANATVKFKLGYRPTMTISSSSTYKGGTSGIGGAGLFQIGSPRLAIETGAVYNNELFNGVTSANIDIPFVLRYNMSQVLSVAVGGFFDIQTGSVQTGFNSTNYGLRAGVEADIPMSSKVGFILQGNFHYGLANMIKTGTALYQHEASGVVGIRFGS